jgi:antitoxin ParD1/3/4
VIATRAGTSSRPPGRDSQSPLCHDTRRQQFAKAAIYYSNRSHLPLSGESGHVKKYRISVLWAQSLNQQTQLKNTSITLGEHFDLYIAEQLASGRYRTASELIRESLRLHEEREVKIAAMRAAIEEGLASGVYQNFSFEELTRELDAELGR